MRVDAGRSLRALCLTAAASLVSVTPAMADNLVVNGNFEVTTHGPGQFNYSTQATGWNSTGYNFIFGPGTADTTGSPGQYGVLKLWGPGTGSANGLPSASPAGGNFVAADGAFGVGPITQTINGLVVGKGYLLTFYYAGAQQYGYAGPTTEQWQVSLGGQTQLTPILNDPSHGFTGWQLDQMTFTATSTSEVLSFLAIGTPNGVPPFALLDGVSLTQVPEPGSMMLFASGMLGLGMFGSRKRTSN